MSNRVLKKFLPSGNDLSKLDGQSETEDEAPSIVNSASKKKQLAANRFELLTGMDHSLSDTEAKEDDDRENEPPPDEGGNRNKLEKQDSTHSTDSLKRRKKKKKKKKLRSQQSLEDNLGDGEDEVDVSLKEVNKLLGEPEHSAPEVHPDQGASLAKIEKSLLSVDLRNLNPDNELRRIFGSKVIQADQVKKRARGRAPGRSTVMVPGKNWSRIGKPSISMNLVETKGDVQYFVFEHSKQYQSIQFQFLDAVETFNPDNIVALLNIHPYHVDSLIQFSDICRMGEDQQMAAELIERALYCLEICFHPLFNITQGTCRLDYRRAENRSFFIALFKHLTFLGQRGCSKTALEFCKLLLGLDPDGDPLCVTLMLDFYALKAEQFDYLIRFFHEWEPVKNLSQLPNFAFSVPLAMFCKAKSAEQSSADADKMLQKSLIMFPGVLLPLLERCGIQPDPAVAQHPFFIQAQADQTPALNQLTALFIGRNYALWKDPDVVSWLERNVREVVRQVDAKDPFVREAEEKRKVRYKGTPRNILRHIILSNIKEANLTLPQDLAHVPIFNFDPLPPADAIVSYTRPARPEVTNDRGMVSAFFRSILPNFNLPTEAPGHAGPAPQPREAGAVGGQRGVDTNDLRRSVTSLLDAMRDLLNNIHLADVPNDGDVDSDDEHED